MDQTDNQKNSNQKQAQHKQVPFLIKCLSEVQPPFDYNTIPSALIYRKKTATPDKARALSISFKQNSPRRKTPGAVFGLRADHAELEPLSAC
ncbi:hypothetical protein JOS77_23965 [Chromobacterium haemolyticum]|nr:hypothetical protein JOS77_23965 [Chromobacterium haemolyticum]